MCYQVGQSAWRCFSTLLDLIQTNVKYVVLEAVVIIKDIVQIRPVVGLDMIERFIFSIQHRGLQNFKLKTHTLKKLKLTRWIIYFLNDGKNTIMQANHVVGNYAQKCSLVN